MKLPNNFHYFYIFCIDSRTRTHINFRCINSSSTFTENTFLSLQLILSRGAGIPTSPSYQLWTRRGLNPRPPDYESVASNLLSYKSEHSFKELLNLSHYKYNKNFWNLQILFQNIFHYFIICTPEAIRTLDPQLRRLLL